MYGDAIINVIANDGELDSEIKLSNSISMVAGGKLNLALF